MGTMREIRLYILRRFIQLSDVDLATAEVMSQVLLRMIQCFSYLAALSAPPAGAGPLERPSVT